MQFWTSSRQKNLSNKEILSRVYYKEVELVIFFDFRFRHQNTASIIIVVQLFNIIFHISLKIGIYGFSTTMSSAYHASAQSRNDMIESTANCKLSTSTSTKKNNNNPASINIIITEL